MWGVSEFTATGNLKKYNRINDIKQLKMPVLLTAGRFDEATPETLKKVKNKLKEGKLIVYEKSAHFAFLEERKKYIKNLDFFLQKYDKKSVNPYNK